MSKLRNSLILIALATLACQINAQENSQTRVMPSVLQCYQNRTLFERDLRLPMTVNTLIEIVRKIEDTQGFNADIRQTVISILHNFRQDGIVRATGIPITSPNILPYSPTAFQFYKHRILFSRLLPNIPNVNFPNQTLTTEERCALHFMLSSSVETQIRGDEGTVCPRLSQFRAALRSPRSANEDAEMLSQSELQKTHTKLRRTKFGRMAENEEDVEEDPAHEDDNIETEMDTGDEDFVRSSVDHGLVDIASNAVSQCPVENGIMRTNWGQVSVGAVLGGIAAGLEPQRVQIRDLIPKDRLGEIRARQVAGNTIDNRWAATLAGDLAEVALLQIPQNPSGVTIGASGSWNSSIPRWFFLVQRNNFEITDAEIRGGIDGLILANNIINWRNSATGLRLSQLLEMYYTHRGVFGTNVRSCNRRTLFSANVPTETLRQQTNLFSQVLDREITMPVTLQPPAILQFSQQAADALAAYVPTHLNDLSCEQTAIVVNDPTIWTAASDIFIFVDASWPARQIIPVVAHILDGIDVGRFGSSYTILNAQDGRVLVNTTNELTSIHTQWTPEAHQSHPGGLNLPALLRVLRTRVFEHMENERRNSSSGGRSKIALIIPQMAAVSEGESNTAWEQLQIFREEVPDLRFLYLAGGNPTRFNRFVRDERQDIFQLNPIDSGAIIDSVNVQLTPVILRIMQEPRRIINHRCGGNWHQTEWGTSTLVQYIEPGGIVFYRLHPNYFFGNTDGNRVLRIQGRGFGQITVCQSRFVERPRSNQTNNQNQDSVNCRQISGEAVEIHLSRGCDGHGVIHNCPPVFVSVVCLV
uniref:Putative secreted protein n=1 Tax=Corethrella appendiculata TaxID=1370023 RepID=U5ESY0_9DIPT